MIATIKTGARHAALLLKPAQLAVAVLMAGGVVAHARDVYQDRHAESIVDDQIEPVEAESRWGRIRGWVAQAPKVIRVRTATAVLLYVIGIVVAAEFSEASCVAGHMVGCKIAKNLIGAGS